MTNLKQFVLMKWIFALTIVVLSGFHGFTQTNLMNVKPWAYWLQTIDLQTIIDDASFELIVMDYSADGLDAQKWTSQQINLIKNSGKYAISYISIGEAEDYRYYWQASWDDNPPAWLGPENPDWPGNFETRFWNPQWQEIIYNYLDTILMQGFDGIYMDLIDNYYYWSVTNPEQPLADSLMCRFVIDIRNYCDSVRGNSDFILLPQNGADIIDQENVSPGLKTAYLNAINGIGVEDVFFPGDLDEDNIFNPDSYRIEILQQYLENNKQVYAIDYLTNPNKIDQFIDAAVVQGFVPYTCTRPLDILCGGIVTGLDDIEFNSINNIVIYPNPAGNFLKLSIKQLVPDNKITIKIFNSDGILIEKHNFKSSVSNSITLNISNYKSGVYVVEFSHKNRVKTKTFIVAKEKI